MVIGCIERGKGIAGCASQDLAEMPERAAVGESTLLITERHGGIQMDFSVLLSVRYVERSFAKMKMGFIFSELSLATGSPRIDDCVNGT
jgi:hypothetical protein